MYNINWSVFITEPECVYCAVRTENLNKFQGKLNIIQYQVVASPLC